MLDNNIALATGGFDPVHGGHIDYLKASASLGNMLIVGLNSDRWLERKKGKSFMSFSERKSIIESLECVHKVIEFNDDDGTANDAIQTLLRIYGNDIVFCNGGDRTLDNVQEDKQFQDTERVSFAYNVGGGKKNSSSILLGQWERNITNRDWGYYEILYEVPQTKVKELVVKPGESLSMQQHEHRSEHWFIASGEATVKYQAFPYCDVDTVQFEEHDILTIPRNCWHQLSNDTDKDLNIVEIQYGKQCTEEDIVRENDK